MTLFHDFVATLTVKPVILLDGSRVMLYAISPEQAQALNVRKAACNNLNRAISASKVTAYRKIISEGNWCPMLDEITYLHVPGHDRHGQLISGQHRLQAIAMGTTTVAVRIRAVTNVKELIYTDTGMARNAHQNIGLNYAMDKQTSLVAMYAYAIMEHICGRRFTMSGQAAPTQIIPISQQMQVMAEHGDVFARTRRYPVNSYYLSALVRALCALLLIGGVDEAQVIEFLRLCSLDIAELATVHPVMYAVTTMVAASPNKSNATALGTIIDLWNSFVSNAVMVDTSSTVLLLDPASADIYRQVR